ncbi:hypothetical protein BH18ACT12_BH18ACT12_06030 [soil metagenome]
MLNDRQRAARLRPLGVAVAVGGLTGLVLAGGGSRLAMRLVAVADEREDFGVRTDAGAVVGDVTLGGTVSVLLTGAALGVLGALVYLGLRRWLPRRTAYCTLVFALVILGLGLGVVIEGNQGDFVFLNTVVSVVSFAVVLLLYAVAVPPLLERFVPRAAGRSSWGRGLVGVIVVLALTFGALAVKHAFEFADGSRLPS